MTYNRFPTDLRTTLAGGAILMKALSCLQTWLWIGALGVAVHADEGTLEFNRDIRPILSANCFSCHGPDAASHQADLRLDEREVAIEFAAIVPGDPDSSEMLRRIASEDDDEVMPPPESKKQLTAGEKSLVARWIREGAEYQPHWSFVPPQRSELPAVENLAWARQPLDHFVLQRLEKEGLAPAPEADRRTLIRRLSFDLTGLPPSAEDVEVFLADEQC